MRADTPRRGSPWTESVRAAAFERQLGGDLVPAVADLAEHVGVGDEDVVEGHLVEVVFARHQMIG